MGFGHYANSSFSLSVSPIAPDAAGMQRDYWYGVNRSFARLESPKPSDRRPPGALVREVGVRKAAILRPGAGDFDPEVAGSLLSHLCSALSGMPSIKASFALIGQLGQQIAGLCGPFMTTDGCPAVWASRPFDGEGCPML